MQVASSKHMTAAVQCTPLHFSVTGLNRVGLQWCKTLKESFLSTL